jgi:SAM-dependent methyltransferase
VGIFLISFSVILLELLLTRIFSVTMYHHLSFLAVSLAMMGLGFGGIIVNLRPTSFRRDNLGAAAAPWSLLFAVSTIVTAAVAFHTPVSLRGSAGSWTGVALIMALCVVPFSSGGTVIAHVLAHRPERANRFYCYDLVGAGLGCIAFIPLTSWVGPPTALLLTAAVTCLAGAVLAGRHAGWRLACALGLVSFAGAAAANTTLDFFDLRFVKGWAQGETLAIRWNSFSRVDVSGSPEDMERAERPGGWGLSSELPPSWTAKELRLRYDGGALTQIVGFDGDLAEVEYLLYDVASAPYHARRYGRVLVLGAGGGRDVLSALASSANHVTGVEINELTIDLMQGQFREFTGGLYTNHPQVRVVHNDGRNFVRSSNEKYDLIQASLVDTWAASSAGAYALAENSLYTVDAFEDFFSRLTPDGIVSFTRWYGSPPVEALRLVLIEKTALLRLGVLDPARHFYVVRTRRALTGHASMVTVLVKLSPFRAEEVAALDEWADRMRFAVSYSPLDPDRQEAPLLDVLTGNAAEYVAKADYDLSVVTDERPFFFDRVPLLAWIAHRIGLPAAPYGASELTAGGRTLLIALLVTASCTLALLVLPVLGARLRREQADGDENRLPGFGASGPWILYFGCLGSGYILVEIVLIQRFNLYFGNPVYALSVVLFTMLLSSGAGSFVAQRWSTYRQLTAVVATVCVALGGLAVAVPWAIDSTLGSSNPLRILVAVACIAPAAGVMGMPFATGLRYAARESRSLVSWAWAVNGGASVFGSVVAVLISMTAGFSRTFLAGVLAYLLALGTVAVLGRRRIR